MSQPLQPAEDAVRNDPSVGTAGAADPATVPSAHASLAASRGALPTHERSLTHPAEPAPSVNPSGGGTGHPGGPTSDRVVYPDTTQGYPRG